MALALVLAGCGVLCGCSFIFDSGGAELPLIEEWFEKIGTALPTSMRDELESLKTRLN